MVFCFVVWFGSSLLVWTCRATARTAATAGALPGATCLPTCATSSRTVTTRSVIPAATTLVAVAVAGAAEAAMAVEVGVVEGAATSAILGGIAGQEACKMGIISLIGMGRIGVDVAEVLRAVVSQKGSVTCPGTIGGRSQRGRATRAAGVSLLQRPL